MGQMSSASVSYRRGVVGSSPSLTNVVDDKGIRRPVMDLKVKCDLTNQGCTWEGDLGRLQEHMAKDCSVTSMKKFMDKIDGSLTEKDEMIENLEDRICLPNSASVLVDTKMNEFMENVNDQLTSFKDTQAQLTGTKMAEFMGSMNEQFASLEGKLYQKDEEICLLKHQVSLLQAGSFDACKAISENLTSSDGNEKDESDFVKVKDMLRQKDSKISLLEYQLACVTHDLFQSRELSLRGKSIPKESYSCVSNIPKNLCGGAKGNNTNSANNICY